jgi:ribosomal protein L40E
MTDEASCRDGELLICRRCSGPYDPGDRFCRKCGAALDTLPMTREDYAPDLWRSPVPAIARGIVVVAAGTLAELALRRAIRMLFRPSNFLPALRHNSTSVTKAPPGNGIAADAVIESEAFTVRRVRVRHRD